MAYTAGPFDSMHLYLQWFGTLPGNEQFSCGLRLRNKGSGLATHDSNFADEAVAVVSTYHTSSKLYLSPNAKLTGLKVNAIGTDGHYVAQTTNERPIANLGGTGTQTPPNQIACAISLTTGFSRGPAHRGRFYLPLPGNSIAADGRMSAASAADMSLATDDFIDQLNAINTSWEVAVFSRKAGVAGNRRVTGNLVGRVYDTQRRRRRSLVEDYQ